MFGAGLLGERYYSLLRDDYNIICFADNDINKQGKKLFSLDIICPEEITKLGLSVIIACKYQNCLEIIRQLFEIGVKEYYVPNGSITDSIMHIDFTKYNDISEKTNKVCVLGSSSAGTFSKALVAYNPYTDLDVVAIRTSNKDSDFYYHYLTSSLIISHNADDIRGKKTIELWHGFPIKSLFYMAQEKHDRYTADNVHDIFFKRDAICSLSKLYSLFVGYCLKIEYEKFIITGYPHNDMLLMSDGRKNLEKLIGTIRQKCILFYLPTYREGNGITNGDPDCAFIYNMSGYNSPAFSKYLKQNDILFVYKMHTMQNRCEFPVDNENIIEISETLLNKYDTDLYAILNAADCLISDYSSVIIDFLLVDKPIIFTPLDLEEYAKTRVLLVEPYEAWMPGEVTVTYEQLIAAIDNVLYGNDTYNEDRNRLRKITHRYFDANSTGRVLNVARRLLNVGDEIVE